MFWILIGVVPGLIAAAAAFLLAVRLRPRALHSRPAHPLLVALLAGMLWPIVVIGLTEFAVVAAMPTALRHRGRHPGDAADTTALAQR